MEESFTREFYEHEICVRLHTGLFFQCWRILVSCVVAPVMGKKAVSSYLPVSGGSVPAINHAVLSAERGVFNDVVTYVESGYQTTDGSTQLAVT